jgi:acrylyl-CoA reductase (NADPH)
MFKALVLQGSEGDLTPVVREVDEAEFGSGDVTVAVEYSSLNYKDGMVIKGIGRLVREYPHIPGVDLAGVVETSDHPSYRPGDHVVLTGWRVGEIHWGGYAQKARVKGDWLVPLPDGLTSRRAMALGTAGLAAMLSVMAMESHGLRPRNGEVLVTGASGGVGSVAIAILKKLGYEVVASTGRLDEKAYLKKLGAAYVMDREVLTAPTKKLIESERWAGCVDNVGGATLTRVLAQSKYRAPIAAVGLAGGATVDVSLMPFLLRGICLLGIDSTTCPIDMRLKAWHRLVKDTPMDLLDELTEEATLEDLPRLADEILAGRVRGRTVINPNA